MRYWLKSLREQFNYSMSDMAHYMGISRQYYSYIENGERLQDLTFSIAIKISKIFNISLDEIKQLEEKGKKNES